MQIVHDLARFGRRQEADEGPVTVEAEIAVVRHDVDGSVVPRDGGVDGAAWPSVVDGADIEATEADSRPETEHGRPRGGVVGVEQRGDVGTWYQPMRFSYPVEWK